MHLSVRPSDNECVRYWFLSGFVLICEFIVAYWFLLVKQMWDNPRKTPCLTIAKAITVFLG